MRNTIIIIVLLTFNLVTSQDRFIDFLIPVKTYHFSDTEKHRYASGEGGNAGLVVSYTSNKHRVNNVYSLGYIRNSYGKWSAIGTYGQSFNAAKWLRIEFNIGFATNYADAYKATYFRDKDGVHLEYAKGRSISVNTPRKRAEMAGFLYKNDIIPVVMFTSKIKIYKSIGAAISVNPMYINGAINITL